MKKIVALLLAAAMPALILSACGKAPAPQSQSTAAVQTNPNLDTSQPVTLTVCGAWTSCKAFEVAAQEFAKTYPNFTVEYEYLQNYNESLMTRLQTAPESVDLFLQSSTDQLPYAEELTAHSELDLSMTNDSLMKNFTSQSAESGKTQLFSVPMGGEIRGLYVNKTLLASLGLQTPTNAKELLAACETLKQAGYVPLNGNPGMFGQWLMYPEVCSLIANADDYETVYAQVNTCEPGVSEVFREPMSFLYQLCENDYYNYKYVETELNMFTDNSNEALARYFFNVQEGANGFAKVDDLGVVPFMAGTLTQQATVQKSKEDYHSEIEYEFILAPVGEQGGYAYISPANGVAINKNSQNLAWAIEFLNYLCSETGSTRFAEELHVIPNTKDSFGFVQDTFGVPADRISDVGQITMDYNFYPIINDALTTVSKSNNPKYMNTDAAGNPVMYDFEYYMQQLEDAFAAQRESGGQ